MKDRILEHIKTEKITLEVFDSLDSTNDYLKKAALSGALYKTVVFSNYQTAGKGTRSRSFISDRGGVYLSLLLRADFSKFDPTLITPLTAVAVSDSIKEISDKEPKIKWVNDIYLDEKKVCGILCETVTVPKEGIPFIVVGIGVNFSRPENGLNEEIKDIATYIFEEENQSLKEKFIASIIDNFFFYFDRVEEKIFLEKYRSQSFLLGKKVYVHSNDKVTEATAAYIDDDCRLVVEFPDKTLKTLCTGDVSVKI